MTDLIINTLFRLPDGRIAKVITAPVGTSRFYKEIDGCL